MTGRNAVSTSNGKSPGYAGYLALAAIAFGAGAVFRFWDIGGAPLAVDEYFFGTSILNIVERGLPEFACGGFYTRGVLIQYLSLPILSLGASLEFAARFWPAVASLLSIAAVWRIARLAGGVKAAAIAAILVSLSVWEVEFSRFGRMYSPFQAVFLWYVYLQLLHLIRGSNKARWSYLALSAVSIFVYAGASFLLVFNFLALVWAGKRWSAGHLIVAAVLLVFGVGFYANDFRHFGVPPEAAPPTAQAESGLSLPVNIPVLPDLTLPIVVLGLFFIGYMLLRYRSKSRISHPSFIYWALAIACACFGLFGFGFGLIAAGLLLRLPPPLAESGPHGTGIRALLIPIVALAVWLGVLTALFGLRDESLWAGVKDALNYAINYPDLYRFVVRPWFQAIPVTTVILTLMCASQVWVLLVREQHRQSEELAAQRFIAAALVLLVMLSALFKQPYTITRYTYFLYPLILVLASTSILYWAALLFKSPRMRSVGAMIPVVLLFAVAEDFQLGHLIRINEPEIRYRTAYNDVLAVHYYHRWDFRAAASFVNERLNPSDAVIVFEQPLPHYLHRTSGIFIRKGTDKHSLISGCGGERDLWSNAPLLDTESEVHRLMAQTNGSVWLIMRTAAYRWRDPLEISLPQQYGLEPEYITQDAHLAVYRLPPG